MLTVHSTINHHVKLFRASLFRARHLVYIQRPPPLDLLHMGVFKRRYDFGEYGVVEWEFRQKCFLHFSGDLA